MTPPTLEALTIVELPYFEDSAHYFKKIRGLEWPIWLDSGHLKAQPNPHARYDIISAAPHYKIITTAADCLCIPGKNAQDQTTRKFPNCWSAIENLVPQTTKKCDLPFTGGALGYLGYDLGRELENLKNTLPSDHDAPTSLLGIYNWGIIQDHKLKTCSLIHNGNCTSEFAAQLIGLVEGNAPTTSVPVPFSATEFKANTRQERYLSQIERIQDYIRAGDCYQVNFTQRFEATFTGDTFEAYQRLRRQLPSPFSCYFETEYGAIMSLSPERFIACNDGRATTQPIKGTSRRGCTPEEDLRLAKELRQSGKNQAENLMIVDLLRNDLSKSCSPNSVKTSKLFDLESYANVHHLVSTVHGQLQPGCTPLSLLKSCFPGGSITGAPKIRAMEIIEELENERRSIYCGSIGYIGFDGQMDTNIAIRTAATSLDRIFVWGGGGIVADSTPNDEYEESLVKIRRILEGLSERPDRA